MLNMSSAAAVPPPDAAGPSFPVGTAAEDVSADGGTADDRTARARIRDAAMLLFGEHGFRATTVRAIAEHADVSPALVVHHFGSKQRLREAVDEHVLALVRDGKLRAMTGSVVPTGDEYAALAEEHLPVMGYLARALVDGSEIGLRLYERLHADAVGYLAAGVEAGVLRPSEDDEARAAVLLNNGLATLLLEPHLERVLATDSDVDVAVRIAPVVLDLYIDALFTDDRFRRAWRGESAQAAMTADPDPPGDDPSR